MRPPPPLTPVVTAAAVMYNFEYVVPRAEMGKHWQAWISDDFLAVHQRHPIWEYSS